MKEVYNITKHYKHNTERAVYKINVDTESMQSSIDSVKTIQGVVEGSFFI